MSKNAQVVVFDYGAGNVRSACRALEAVGAKVRLSSDIALGRKADGLVVPGVGAYRAVMDKLKACGGQDLVKSRVADGKPVLGICVGLQVFFTQGMEGNAPSSGLGLWPGSVQALPTPILPHMGWSLVQAPEDSKLFSKISAQRFYFVHSFAALRSSVDSSWLSASESGGAKITWSHYGQDFIAAIEDGALCATQFHPEKSGAAGLHLLENWLSSW